MKHNFQVGDLFIARYNQENKQPLFKLGYIYNIEKTKRKKEYFIRWEKNQHTPHYLPIEGVYTHRDISIFIKSAYNYVPVK
jgi:hypothetical protein